MAPRARLPLPDLNAEPAHPVPLPDLNAEPAQPTLLPDLNAEPAPPVLLPDLNAEPAHPAPLPDLNAEPAHPAPLPDLNAEPAQPTLLPDLNAVPALPVPADVEMPLVPDLLLLPYADPAEFDIQGEPVPAHVFRLLDQLGQHPDQAPRMLSAAFDLLADIGPDPELREGLEERHEREAGRNPRLAALIWQLIHQVNRMEVEDEEGSEGEPEEVDAPAALALDLAVQQHPLGVEMARWTHGGGEAPRDLELGRFDDETHAPAFARLLGRLREAHAQEGSSAAAAQRAEQVTSVINAICASSTLREQVFLIAQTALGSCHDNVLGGFSKVLLAVRDHRMVDDIRAGRVDAPQFHRWAGQQLRLALLEKEVTWFIHRQLQRLDLEDSHRMDLEREPLEYLLRAKQALGPRLDLPEGAFFDVVGRSTSLLTPRTLSAMEQAVLRQARDPAVHREFLMGHSTWRAGMQALHPREFQEHFRLRDADPFFDADIPEDLEGQADYAARARQVEAHWRRREDQLLLRLAGISPPPSPPPGGPAPRQA
ncbi:NEL-type E3 ubiquitin ligase domain-containing protein [Paracidovorax citrulli]|uniref:NEL-type E3 ubiquitin ligase domain-containing protein n=1 Tax=Paracidovorax citrulli TaxID=80869 RepID=UPI000AF1C804|nr:NEL-type E3 ubiquitin ligase domain-containing protein [Paracidovorax citrulli]